MITCSLQQTPLLVIFGFQNDMLMRTMKKIYERFGVLMESDEVLSRPGIDFRLVCRMLRVSPPDLDEVVRKELGMSGEEVVGKCRSRN